MPVRRRPPSRPSLGAVRSPDSQHAILRSAEKLLSSEEFDHFSIEAVAREARASKPTIYKWWGTREHLIGEVYRALAPLESSPPDLGSLKDDLQAYLADLSKIWSDPKWATVSRRLFLASQENVKALSRYRDEYLASRNRGLSTIIERARARGELSPDLDVELLVDTITAFGLFRLLMRKTLDDATYQEFVRLMLKGAAK